jgi:ABC-type lipoprotein export system ATPase subunit
LVDDGKTILMVTHDHDLAKRATRTVILSDGAVAEIGQVVRARIMETMDRTEERERA